MTKFLLLALLTTSIYVLTTTNTQAAPLRFEFTNLGPITLEEDASVAADPVIFDNLPQNQTNTNLTLPTITIPFSFTISNTSLDFGTLTPNTLTTKTQTLTISSHAGYSLSASQNHPLKLTNSTITIADIKTGDWTNPDQYGFGFSLTPPNFKPLINQSAGQPASPIFTLTNQSLNQPLTITYQINISPTQASGDYQNQINYLALPTY